MLAPLGAVPGVRFYGLQKEAGADEALSPPPGLDFVDLGPGLADFADTAAVLSVLDLVVTVDTAAGHLAGALGRPVWVLLWATHDWHWLLDREDTPWYPTMRLFRQERPNAWEPVIARVEAALRDGAGANDPS
jgi:ADP-heptose:LPS heptosyltransferase